MELRSRTGMADAERPIAALVSAFSRAVTSKDEVPPEAVAQPPGGKRPIAVIGGGFSGPIAALQLLRRLPADQPVLLCEATPDSIGVPGDLDHLLNVRASNMSAINDEPLHFEAWLERRTTNGRLPEGLHDTEAGRFASRGLYTQYLRSLIDYALIETPGAPPLKLLGETVQDIVSGDRGGYELVCASGERVTTAGIVLASGNLPPEEHENPRICHDPWSEKAWRPLEPGLPVLIVGTGLTMVDLATALRKRGFEGGIIAISRGGLLPSCHEAISNAWPTPHFTMAEERSLAQLTTRLRDEVFAAAEAGVDWRAVIDSMRPVTASIWSRLPLVERRRFLRHARRAWDAHRHRMAPPHAGTIGAMLSGGALKVLAGTIVGLEDRGDRVHVRYRPRQRGRAHGEVSSEESLDVQRVIMASGLEHISRTSDPLMQRLLDRGLVRMDPQGLGIDVTDGLNVIRADEEVTERIWALGPIVRGVFWECVAVPDIRVQAAHVAVSVVARLREEAPRWGFMS